MTDPQTREDVRLLVETFTAHDEERIEHDILCLPLAPGQRLSEAFAPYRAEGWVQGRVQHSEPGGTGNMLALVHVERTRLSRTFFRLVEETQSEDEATAKAAIRKLAQLIREEGGESYLQARKKRAA